MLGKLKNIAIVQKTWKMLEMGQNVPKCVKNCWGLSGFGSMKRFYNLNRRGPSVFVAIKTVY